MTKKKKKKLKRHSAMLGQIAPLVEEFCLEIDSTLEGVRFLKSDWESELRWARHYHGKLQEARAAGYLPDDFDF